MEADSADDADDWFSEIRDHIKYANSQASGQDVSAEVEKARANKAMSMKVDRR